MQRDTEPLDLQLKLKALRKNYTSDTTQMAQEVDDQLRDKVDELEIANEAMMDWMADYKPGFENENPADSSIVYYSGQEKEIEEVKTKIEESIDEAGKLLEEIKP